MGKIVRIENSDAEIQWVASGNQKTVAQSRVRKTIVFYSYFLENFKKIQNCTEVSEKILSVFYFAN